MGRSRPRRSDSRPSSGFSAVSIRPASEEDGADRDGAVAARVERERGEHVEHAEEQCRERVEPEPGDERRIGERATHGAALDAPPPGGRGCRTRRDGEEQARPRRCRRSRRGTRRASATAPTIGPRIAPRTAIPKTVPSSWPRSARGVDTVTQERAPAHVSALESPWRKRAMPIALPASRRAPARRSRARAAGAR